MNGTLRCRYKFVSAKEDLSATVGANAVTYIAYTTATTEDRIGRRHPDLSGLLAKLRGMTMIKPSRQKIIANTALNETGEEQTTASTKQGVVESNEPTKCRLSLLLDTKSCHCKEVGARRVFHRH
jgi:hypothetical protein